MGYPLLGVNDLPVLVLVGRAGFYIRMLAGHDPPLILVSNLERHAFAIRSIS